MDDEDYRLIVKVHCRIGSSEKEQRPRQDLGAVHCRIGSSEMCAIGGIQTDIPHPSR